MSKNVVELYDSLLSARAAFVLSAESGDLAVNLKSLSFHLGCHLRLPAEIHQFLFTFGLELGRNDSPIQYFGLPAPRGRGVVALRRVAGLLEAQLSRWYDARLLKRTFDAYFVNDCRSTWVSDIAKTRSASAHVEVTLAPFVAQAELEVARNGNELVRHLLFTAIPHSRGWAALLGSLHVSAQSVWVRSAPGGLIATTGGPVWMGKGKLARRFTLSLESEPSRVSQRWELTRHPLRDPLPMVLSEFQG